MQYTKEQLEEIYQKGIRYKIQQKKPEWMGVLETLNQREKLDTIVEIGCHDGGTSVTLSYFTKHLYTFDMINPCLFTTKEFDPSCKFQYHAMDSHSVDAQNIIKKVGSIDFLMIDGDHTHQGSLKDYVLYSEQVKYGGLIAFHDIVDSANHKMLGCYVSETWKQVKNVCAHKEIIYDNEGIHPKTMLESEYLPGSWGGIGILFKGL
jgi:predicted O-methyltransferase YrrM